MPFRAAVGLWSNDLDDQNERPAYREAVLTGLLNRDFTGGNLDKEDRVARAAAE